MARTRRDLRRDTREAGGNLSGGGRELGTNREGLDARAVVRRRGRRQVDEIHARYRRAHRRARRDAELTAKNDELMARYRGIFANLLTALTPDGSAFEPAAQRDYVEWVLAQKVHGVSTSLSSGEFGY